MSYEGSGNSNPFSSSQTSTKGSPKPRNCSLQPIQTNYYTTTSSGGTSQIISELPHQQDITVHTSPMNTNNRAVIASIPEMEQIMTNSAWHSQSPAEGRREKGRKSVIADQVFRNCLVPTSPPPVADNYFSRSARNKSSSGGLYHSKSHTSESGSSILQTDLSIQTPGALISTHQQNNARNNNFQGSNFSPKDNMMQTVIFDLPPEDAQKENDNLELGDSNSLNLNHLTLGFINKDFDKEYTLKSSRNNLNIWRGTVFVGMIIAVIVFVYEVLNSTVEIEKITLIFCFSVILPLIMLLSVTFSTTSPHHQIRTTRYSNSIAVLSIILMGGVAVSLRHILLQPEEPIYKSAMIYSVVIFMTHLLLQVRFIYYFLMMPAIFAFFLSEAVILGSESLEIFESLVCLLSTMVVCLINSYISEKSSKELYLKTKITSSTNLKLIQQLKRLHKTYSHQAINFDSPLEKSISIVRILLSDPAVKQEHVENLGKLLGLLKSGDLMTPDIDKQVETGKMDKDQEAWLFTNLYRNKPINNQIIKPSPPGRLRANTEAIPHSTSSMWISKSNQEIEYNPAAIRDKQKNASLLTVDLPAAIQSFPQPQPLTPGQSISSEVHRCSVRSTDTMPKSGIGRKMSLKLFGQAATKVLGYNNANNGAVAIPVVNAEDSKINKPSNIQDLIVETSLKVLDEESSLESLKDLSIAQTTTTTKNKQKPQTSAHNRRQSSVSASIKLGMGSDKSNLASLQPQDTAMASEVAHIVLSVREKTISTSWDPKNDGDSYIDAENKFLDEIVNKLEELEETCQPLFRVSVSNDGGKKDDALLNTIYESDGSSLSIVSSLGYLTTASFKINILSASDGQISPSISGSSQQGLLLEQQNRGSGSVSILSTNNNEDIASHILIVSILEKSDHWNWEIFDLVEASKGWPLFSLGHFLFSKSDLFSKFKIEKKPFLKFMRNIERGYHKDVPYHNSTHACDVLHGLNWMKDRCSAIVEPSDMELLSMYFAAMIHDFDHPGFNNNFLVSTRDKKALLYNDRSVLENHHIAAGFAVLMRPEYNCNFLSHFSRENFKQFRENVIELVLATDLQTQHFLNISMFKNKISVTETFDTQKQEDRLLLWKMMIKCADVSNPTKKMHIYEKWVDRILDEFFQQGDEEKRAGLPVSPYYDRDNINIPNSQIGFVEFICIPLFEAFNSFQSIPCILEGLRTNRAHWLQQKQEQLQQKLDQQQKNDQQQQQPQPQQQQQQQENPNKEQLLQIPFYTLSSKNSSGNIMSSVASSTQLTAPKQQINGSSNTNIFDHVQTTIPTTPAGNKQPPTAVKSSRKQSNNTTVIDNKNIPLTPLNKQQLPLQTPTPSSKQQLPPQTSTNGNKPFSSNPAIAPESSNTPQTKSGESVFTVEKKSSMQSLTGVKALLHSPSSAVLSTFSLEGKLVGERSFNVLPISQVNGGGESTSGSLKSSRSEGKSGNGFNSAPKTQSIFKKDRSSDRLEK